MTNTNQNYQKLEEDESLILMNYDTWITKTRLTFGSRSSEFSQIDSALQIANNSLQSLENPEDTQKKLKALRIAMQNWMATKKNWWESERNKNGAITKLYEQVCVATVEPRDLPAFQFLKSEYEKNLFTMFGRGVKFTLKSKPKNNTTVQKIKDGSSVILNAISTINDIKTTLKHEASKKFEDKFKEGLSAIGDLSADFFSGTVNKLFNIFSGVIQPFQSLARSLIQSVADICTHFSLKKMGQLFSPGLASNAFQAVRKLKERNSISNAVDTAIDAVNSALTICLNGLPSLASTVLKGIGNSIKDFFRNIILYKKELHEINQANIIFTNFSTLINSKELQSTSNTACPLISDQSEALFTICPLAGCYFLAYSDLSSIINLDVAMIGSFKFKERVEKIKKEMGDVISIADKYIQDSDYEILGLTRHPDIRNFLKKLIDNLEETIERKIDTIKNKNYKLI